MADLTEAQEIFNAGKHLNSEFKSFIYSIVRLLPVDEKYIPLLSIFIWIVFICAFLKTTLETGKYVALIGVVFLIMIGMGLLA